MVDVSFWVNNEIYANWEVRVGKACSCCFWFLVASVTNKCEEEKIKSSQFKLKKRNASLFVIESDLLLNQFGKFYSQNYFFSPYPNNFITLFFQHCTKIKGPQIIMIVFCMEGREKKKKKKACSTGQLETQCSELSASHCCLVQQEQKAAPLVPWGPDTVYLKHQQKLICTRALHQAVVLLSSPLPLAPWLVL